MTANKVKVFDMYSGDEYPVKMQFRNELADVVIDQFGRDVMMIPLDDGHFTITVECVAEEHLVGFEEIVDVIRGAP